MMNLGAICKLRMFVLGGYDCSPAFPTTTCLPQNEIEQRSAGEILHDNPQLVALVNGIERCGCLVMECQVCESEYNIEESKIPR